MMKTKKIIFLLVILGIAAATLTACGSFPRKSATSVSFPKTLHTTTQGTETITNYSHDRVIVHEDGHIEVRGTMQCGDEEYSVQWLYTPEGKPIGSREMQQTGSADYMLFFDNCFDFVPGENGVVKVEGKTVYYEDRYEVYELENDVIRRITIFSNDKLSGEYRMNEFGQLTQLEFYGTNGDAYLKIAYTYEEVPVK